MTAEHSPATPFEIAQAKEAEMARKAKRYYKRMLRDAIYCKNAEAYVVAQEALRTNRPAPPGRSRQ